ncbi:hypothetical protein PF003_g38048 [Phytophthora fragariae]|nr:hypothetical protein PF003_g38048 [Phytophthora fragariae]
MVLCMVLSLSTMLRRARSGGISDCNLRSRHTGLSVVLPPCSWPAPRWDALHDVDVHGARPQAQEVVAVPLSSRSMTALASLPEVSACWKWRTSHTKPMWFSARDCNHDVVEEAARSGRRAKLWSSSAAAALERDG